MKVLVYIECADLSCIDDAFEKGLEDGGIEKYAALTIDGQPLMYCEDQDSASDTLLSMSLRCAGITEE